MAEQKSDVVLTLCMIVLAIAGAFYIWSVQYQQTCFIYQAGVRTPPTELTDPADPPEQAAD